MVAYLGYSMDISEENLSVGNTTVDTRAIDVMGATRAFRWVRKNPISSMNKLIVYGFWPQIESKICVTGEV